MVLFNHYNIYYVKYNPLCLTEESKSVIISQIYKIYFASHTLIVNLSRSTLRLNVGFITNLTVGSSREFLFDNPQIHLQPDLDLKDLIGKARVTRTPQGLLVEAQMRAIATLECGRCLNEYEQPLEIDFKELYVFPGREREETDLRLPADGKIDLTPLVREYMILEVPINPICTPDCKGICSICGENITESPHSHEQETIDPRLAVLKELLDEE